MNFGIETEISDALVAEIQPLLELHWGEIARHKDIPLEPDWDRYRHAMNRGVLSIYTMRTDEKVLIGYALFIVAPHWHYASVLGAGADIVWLHPDYRDRIFSFIKFLKWCDERLRELGVQIVTHRAKSAHPALGDLLVATGLYDLTEFTYQRRLK